MTLTLPNSIASQQDIASLLSELRSYKAWLSHEAVKQKVANAPATMPPALSVEASTVMQAWMRQKPLTEADVVKLIEAIEKVKAASPTITITLAAVPSGEVKARLVAWCRKEISPSVLVTFRLNRNILGGLVVAYGSKIHDWSFRRKLLSHSKPFHEVLAHV